jgi:hypothetical protein
MAQISAATLAAGQAETGQQSPVVPPDNWNWWAVNKGGAPTLPDPMQLFGSRDPIDFYAWRSKTAQWVAQQGLSGYLRGLGIVARRRAA